MLPSQLATLLGRAIPAHVPVLITGMPGCAKTDIVTQATAAAGADLIMTHPAIGDPTDVKGLPWAEKGAKQATFLPFGDLARALAATKLTVWAFDDLGQAPPAMQAGCMQLFLARRVNEHVLPECITFVAMTNRRTDRAGVAGLLEPVKSRFATIVELKPDLQEWCTWALQQSYIPPELVAFLRFRSELFCQFSPSADLVNCPLPRTWAHAGRLLGLSLPAEVEAAALNGAVGEGAATEFLAFLQMYRELPNIDGILIDPDSAKIPVKPAALYAVATALASRATEVNFARIGRYGQRLVDAGHGEFAALLIRDCIRRNGEVVNTPAFVKLAAGELGKLIGSATK